ncbi:MAG: hypothetical protein KJZ85_15185 [Rhodobacteraceae bacterium]|jgi:hypothetical protein|nr:hypothetical protein [Paracoccaceae bacterium]
MCWSLAATAAMVAGGGAATAVSLRRRDTPAIPLTLGYFTLMEALQLAGYTVVGQCESPANQSVTLLSVLHIVFQPLVINAFAMAITGQPRRAALRWGVHLFCAAAAASMLLQLYPFAWAGACAPGSNLCAERLCTVAGAWHIGWDVPYNGLFVPLEAALGTSWGFPGYILAVFVLPLAYGAWRFVLFHAALGPILAGMLTDRPNEVPAIWCLFSIGLVLAAASPRFRRLLAPRAEAAAAAGP